MQKYFGHIITDKRTGELNKCSLKNYAFIKRWVDLYQKGGIEALAEKRGRRKKSNEPLQAVIVSDEKMQEIIERLIKVRQKSGYTGRELSQIIGKSKYYIEKMERIEGGFTPSIKTFLAILFACKISPTEFFASSEQRELIYLFNKATPSQKADVLEILKK